MTNQGPSPATRRGCRTLRAVLTWLAHGVVEELVPTQSVVPHDPTERSVQANPREGERQDCPDGRGARRRDGRSNGFVIEVPPNSGGSSDVRR